MKVFVCKSENVDNSNDVYINMNMNEILRAQPKFHIISTKKKQQQTKFWEIEYIVVYNANIVA